MALEASYYQHAYEFSTAFLHPPPLEGQRPGEPVTIAIPRYHKQGHHRQCATLPIEYKFLSFGALESLLNYRNESIYVGARHEEQTDSSCVYVDFQRSTSTSMTTSSQCAEERQLLSGTACNRDLRMHFGRGSTFELLHRLREWRQLGVIQLAHDDAVLKNSLNYLENDLVKSWHTSNIFEKQEKFKYFRTNLLLSLHTSIRAIQDWILSEWTDQSRGMMTSVNQTVWSPLKPLLSEQEIPIIDMLHEFYGNMTLSIEPSSTDSFPSLEIAWHESLSMDQYSSFCQMLSTQFQDFIYQLNAASPSDSLSRVTMTKSAYATAAAVDQALVFHASLFEKVMWKQSLTNCSVEECFFPSSTTIVSQLQEAVNSLYNSLSALDTSAIPSCLQQLTEEFFSSQAAHQSLLTDFSVDVAHRWTHCIFHETTTTELNENGFQPIFIAFDGEKAKKGTLSTFTSDLNWKDAGQNLTLVSLLGSMDDPKFSDLFPTVMISGHTGSSSAVSLVPILSFFFDNVFSSQNDGLSGSNSFSKRGPPTSPSYIPNSLFYGISAGRNRFSSAENQMSTNEPSNHQKNVYTPPLSHNRKLSSSINGPEDCLPGLYWSGVNEDCVPCPPGYWSTDGYKHQCTNGYSVAGRIVYTGLGTSTSNCSFICINANEYRVEDHCEVAPVGKYPIDGGFRLGECFNPKENFEFLTPGKTGDPSSCTYIPKSLLTVNTESQFDPLQNYTISFYMKIDPDLLLRTLQLEKKDPYSVGVAMSILDFESHDFGVVTLFKKRNGSESIIDGQLTIRLPNLVFRFAEMDALFEVDGKWHHYSVVYNDHMHTIAFYKDEEHLSAHWIYSEVQAYTSATPKDTSTTIHVGGFFSTVESEFTPNYRLMPAQMASVNIRQEAFPLPLIAPSKYTWHNFSCSQGGLWSRHRCFQCSDKNMQYSGEDTCSCSFGQYRSVDDPGTCNWCPLRSLGTNSEAEGKKSCNCMLGDTWYDDVQRCEASKEAYPAPNVLWTIWHDDFSNPLPSNVFPQYSVMHLETPSIVTNSSRESTRLRCKILHDSSSVVMNKYIELDEMPLHLTFSRKGEYSVQCSFEEEGREDGIALTRIFQIKSRLPHVRFYNQTAEVHTSPVALMLSSDIPQTTGTIMYSSSASNFSTWKAYEPNKPPVLGESQTVSIYLKSKSPAILDGPMQSLEWNIQLPPADDQTSEAASQDSSSSSKSQQSSNLQENGLDAAASLAATMEWCSSSIALCGAGMILVIVVPILCGISGACCCILFRMYRERRVQNYKGKRYGRIGTARRKMGTGPPKRKPRKRTANSSRKKNKRMQEKRSRKKAKSSHRSKLRTRQKSPLSTVPSRKERTAEKPKRRPPPPPPKRLPPPKKTENVENYDFYSNGSSAPNLEEFSAPPPESTTQKHFVQEEAFEDFASSDKVQVPEESLLDMSTTSAPPIPPPKMVQENLNFMEEPSFITADLNGDMSVYHTPFNGSSAPVLTPMGEDEDVTKTDMSFDFDLGDFSDVESD